MSELSQFLGRVKDVLVEGRQPLGLDPLPRRPTLIVGYCRVRETLESGGNQKAAIKRRKVGINQHKLKLLAGALVYLLKTEIV